MLRVYYPTSRTDAKQFQQVAVDDAYSGYSTDPVIITAPEYKMHGLLYEKYVADLRLAKADKHVVVLTWSPIMADCFLLDEIFVVDEYDVYPLTKLPDIENRIKHLGISYILWTNPEASIIAGLRRETNPPFPIVTKETLDRFTND